MELKNRKSPRAKFHNYSGGLYFITICTAYKKHFFGEIHNCEMHLTEIGKFAESALLKLKDYYPYIEIPQHVVMPNHIHFIISIEPSKTDLYIPEKRTILSVVIGSFKQTVTMYARRNSILFDWQTRYHDHIIRDQNDGNMIGKYIDENVNKWDQDCFNQINPKFNAQSND